MFNDSIILIGGKGSDNKPLNDVWQSYDGADWQLLTNNAKYESRSFHSSVVHNNEI